MSHCGGNDLSVGHMTEGRTNESSLIPFRFLDGTVMYNVNYNRLKQRNVKS